MTGRISTSGMHDAAIRQMLARQADLSRTQTQISTGKRVVTPADDPVAATQITSLQQSRSALGQYKTNSDALASRLGVNEQAFASVTDVLQRVRELAVQANNGTLDSATRSSIGAELTSRLQELEQMANQRDANGEYLFAGTTSQTQPFSRNSTGVTYNGDQGARLLQVGPDQQIADGFSGQTVFMNIPEGNGTFSVAQGVHTGASSIDTGQVVNAGAWVPGSYTLQFTSASAWQVVDSASTVVASGAYSSGQPISFNGVQVTVTGTPATGDTYSINSAGKRDLFTTMDRLIAAVNTQGDDAVTRTSVNTGITQALAQIDQALNHVSDLRAEVGARLSVNDGLTEVRQQLDDSLAGSVGDLQDLDYAEAVSRMNLQVVGLQAAQQAYARISKLSLFDYL